LKNQSKISQFLKYLPLWFVIFDAMEYFILMLLNWNLPFNPEHSFSSFGIGVLFTVLFPGAWITIYCICHAIIKRNARKNIMPTKSIGDGNKNDI